MSVYQGEFSSWSDVQAAFCISESLEEKTILLARYDTPPYEGYADVVYMEKGCFYAVSASHCSCYGLEGQWLPELTTLDELIFRAERGSLGNKDFLELLRKIRKDLDTNNTQEPALV